MSNKELLRKLIDGLGLGETVSKVVIEVGVMQPTKIYVQKIPGPERLSAVAEAMDVVFADVLGVADDCTVITKPV